MIYLNTPRVLTFPFSNNSRTLVNHCFTVDDFEVEVPWPLLTVSETLICDVSWPKCPTRLLQISDGFNLYFARHLTQNYSSLTALLHDSCSSNKYQYTLVPDRLNRFVLVLIHLTAVLTSTCVPRWENYYIVLQWRHNYSFENE